MQFLFIPDGFGAEGASFLAACEGDGGQQFRVGIFVDFFQCGCDAVSGDPFFLQRGMDGAR